MRFPQRIGTAGSEVSALMKLLRNYMKTCLKTAEKNRMCVRVLGDKTRLDEDIRTRIAELEEATKNNDGLHFQIAINYGSRDEILRRSERRRRTAGTESWNRRILTKKCLIIIWILMISRIRIS